MSTYEVWFGGIFYTVEAKDKRSAVRKAKKELLRDFKVTEVFKAEVNA